MWKRIQTLYLAVSAGLIASMFFCRFATIIGPEGSEEVIRYYEKTPYLILLIMLTTANVFSIATYRTRFLQARVCMLTALILTGFLRESSPVLSPAAHHCLIGGMEPGLVLHMLKVVMIHACEPGHKHLTAAEVKDTGVAVIDS